MNNVHMFAVEANEEKGIKQLQVPLWFWNSAEWCAFTQASSRAQKPTLIQALRNVRDGNLDMDTITPSHDMRRFLRTVVSIISIERAQGNPWGVFPKNKSFLEKLRKWQGSLSTNTAYSSKENEFLNQLRTKIVQLVEARSVQYAHIDFTREEVDELYSLAFSTYSAFGGSDRDALPIDADIPRMFSGEELLRSIEANAEMMGTTEYVEPMLMRIRTLLSDSRMKTITSCDSSLTLSKWLEEYVCPSSSSAGTITIIDLSLVPAEVIHIVTAVIARITLEALQRYRQFNDGNTLPTTIVMEEAHTFVRRYTSDSEETATYSMCTQVFEKIAREGRKFGLGLVLSSQRPSELSPTVLSQCNTFLLHRISNDRDQELVHKLVPDNLRGMLRELPSLPSQRAILLGWASELPVLVHLNFLPKEYRPQSSDPAYWDSWTSSSSDARTIDWKAIVNEWQGTKRVNRGGEIDMREEDEMPF